ncbi:hypothetical protein [Modicisalibacter luteus]|uniref:hypothetical protein n=1 Tax=Modicisalibacter luteus TaxID=453962 RepID=UPI00039A3B29|nr:hypothetical protein GCM10007159_35150 [Halomonas lutea]
MFPSPTAAPVTASMNARRELQRSNVSLIALPFSVMGGTPPRAEGARLSGEPPDTIAAAPTLAATFTLTPY